MQTFESLSRPLLAAVLDSAALAFAYAQYLQAILDSPLWSEDHPNGIRIPWQQAALAAKHTALRAAFHSPGLYLFGGHPGIPLYLGMTIGPLWKRLSKRYVRGKRSQCQLAVDYQTDLADRGIDGFPDEVREWNRRHYGTARLRGAVAFARSGPERIWFTLIPASDAGAVRNLERMLIPVANTWNRVQGHPLLLNHQDI